jgi:hypothetical protein
VSNEDVDVRRELITRLELQPRLYAKEHRHLVAEAIAIARSHPDEFIRHRVEVQLGLVGVIRAVPRALRSFKRRLARGE